MTASFLLGASFLFFPIYSIDFPTYLYIGAVLAHGGRLYVDAWDLKGPGGFLLYGLCALFSPMNMAAVRIFDMLWQAATSLVLSRLTERVTGSSRAGAFAGWSYLLLYFSNTARNVAQPDGFLNLPLVLVAYYAWRAWKEDRPWLLSAAGGFVAAAVLIKFPFGILGVPLLVMATRRKAETRNRIPTRLVALASGFGFPLLVCALFLWAQEGLAEYVKTQFVLAPQYTQRLRAGIDWLGYSFRHARSLYFFPFNMIVLVTMGWCIRRAFQRERFRLFEGFLAFWFLVSLFLLVAGGNRGAHHFLPLIPPLLVFVAAHAVNVWSGPWRTGWMQFLERAALVAALLACGLMISQRAFEANREYRQPDRTIWKEPADFIKSNTAPGEIVYVWGNAPEIYVLSERRAATRFLNSFFLSEEWQGLNLRENFLEEFQRNEPRFVVVLKETEADKVRQIPVGAEQVLFKFPEFQQILGSDYEVDYTRERYAMLRRKPSL